MPIYEFKCDKCGKVIETIAKIGVDNIPCDTCTSTAVRIMSKNSFQLKGSGWYATDYKGKQWPTS